MRAKRKKIYLIILLALLAVILVFLFLIKIQSNGIAYEEKYSADWVGLAEVSAELSSGAFLEIDWKEVLGEKKDNCLTRADVRLIAENLGVSEYIELPGFWKRHVVTRAEWNTVFRQMLDYLDMNEVVSEETFLVLDLMEADGRNVLVTNKGDYFTALSIPFFEKWQSYRIYASGDTCLGIVSFSEEEEEVKDAYLKQMTADSVTFLYQGAQYQIQAASQSVLEPGVCDFVFLNREITTIREKRDAINGDLLSYDEEFIEIEGYGKVSHDGKIPVYRTYGEVAEKSISDVVLGNMELTYITGGENVCAILLKQPANIADIRVLLLSDGGKFRDEVYLKCSTDSSVRFGESVSDAAAMQLLSASAYFGGGGSETLVLEPKDPGAQIYLCDGDGNSVSNGYAGTMEVRKMPDGYTVVNEVPFEQYLYAVVPSEMPSTFAPEALKAQAVCARSYAYGQLMAADLAAYGAHIDDSTSYQVYNKVARTQSTTDAVDATCGQVLTYQGNVVSAYYFSTSMGYTGTADIWNVDDPAPMAYLQQACLNENPFEGDLSTEDGFAAYIATTQNGYDSDIKFYRWSATADFRDKTVSINEIIEARRLVSEKNIQIVKQGSEEPQESLEGLGAVTGISVQQRNSSGAVITLCLQYEHGSVLVKTEYNIRKILGVCLNKITFADGTEKEGDTMLPSAYTTVEQQADGTLILRGGGYGHGLGMSQNGANGMGKSGKSYTDILNYFYRDIVIEEMGNILP